MVCEQQFLEHNNTKYYKYDEQKKIWINLKEVEFTGFIYCWLNDTAKQIKKIVRQLDDDEAEEIKDDKRIKCVIQNFDKTSYITTIINRCKVYLYDEEFVKQMNDVSDYLPIKNGMKINLKTLEVTERTHEDRFTFECPVSLTKSTEVADKFFSEIMPNLMNREYLRRCLGYMLTGDTAARCFFVFYGIGSNGKSLIASLMNSILTEKYYHQCADEVFKEKATVGGPTPHLHALMGKRVGIYSESGTGDKMDLNMCNLKKISGEDKIYARGLFRDPVEFYSPVKLVLLTNYTPPLSAEKAIKDRLRYIFYDQNFQESPSAGEFKKDPEFVKKLQTIYLDQVFTWIVQGAQEYYKTQTINMTEDFQIRTSKLLENEDSIETFINRFVTATPNRSDYIKSKEIFDMYNNFCNENSQRCQPRSTLYNRLEHMKFNTSILHGINVYRNIKCTYNQKQREENGFIDDEENDEIKHANQKIKELEKIIEQLKKENNILKKNNEPIQPIIKHNEDDDDDGVILKPIQIKKNIFNAPKVKPPPVAEIVQIAPVAEIVQIVPVDPIVKPVIEDEPKPKPQPKTAPKSKPKGRPRKVEKKIIPMDETGLQLSKLLFN